MKTSKLGLRVLSALLTLAMVVSMFAALNISVFAASNGKVKTYIATAENVNGTEATAQTRDAKYYSHNYNSYSDYHDGEVTAVSTFDNADSSERYEFRQWKDTAYFYSGSNYAGSETVATPTSATFSFDFYSTYSLGTATVDGAIYDTYYRLIVNNSTRIVEYVKYDDYYILPVFDGIIPDGQTFVAWKDVETGVLYAEGAKILPDSAREYSPLFADIDDLRGYFVYFKDYTTGQIYDIRYYEPGKTALYTAQAPEKTGYTFDCWFIDDSEFDAEVLVPDNAPNKSVFYARWIPNLYNIDITSQVSGNAFINISTTIAGFNSPVTFTVGDSNSNENITGVEILGTQNSRYYAFSYDDATGVYSFTMPAEDVVIRVDTSIDEYAVTFLDENNDFYATRIVRKGETLGVDMPDVPYKYGYYFDKWVISGDMGGSEFTDATPVYSNITVKATYTGVEFWIIKADDCDSELEYLYVRSSIQDKDLTDSVTDHVVATTGDKVYIDVAPTPTYNITGVAVREVGSGDFVVAPTLIKKYKDTENNDCYTFAFEMPVADIEIAVYVSPNSYDVYVEESDDVNGTYRINGVDTTNLAVAQGDHTVIDIIPERGYYVDEVSAYYLDENNNIALPYDTLTDNGDGTWTYDFPMVSSDVYVSITYKAYEYIVDVTSSNDDTFRPVWDTTYNYIAVESLLEDETSKGIITLYDAYGVEITDWVMLEPARSCLLPRDIEDANIGDQISFKIDECIGYDLAEVIVTYADGTKTCPLTLKNGVYYFTMPDDNVVIRAYFVEETYKVTKTTESEEYNTDAEHDVLGEVNINGLREKAVAADYKSLVTVTATPKAGYYVETISYALTDGTNNDGETVVDFSEAANYAGDQIVDGADTTRTVEFYMPACDVEISVTYGKIDYTVTTEVTSGDETGTITVNEVNTYKDQVTFALEPAYGYVLDSFKIENVATGKIIPSIASKIDQTYGAEYTFDMPASKVNITAKYVKDAYTVTYLDTNNSYIGSESIKYKETATLYPEIVSVPNGYHFVGWVSADTETPVVEASVNTDDFVIVKNTVIRAYYDKDETSVIFNETEHGYVAPADSAEKTNAGDVQIEKKFADTVAFTIVPDEGYVIDEIKVIGVHKDLDKNINIEYVYSAADDNYTFVIPALGKADSYAVSTEPINVIVTFKKDVFELKKDIIGENGAVEVNGKVSTDDIYTYEYLDIVTITATPDKGYYVAAITATMVDTNATNTEGGDYTYTYVGTVPANDVYGTVESISFPMPATDMTYSVTYAKCNFTITSIVESGAATGTLVAPTLQQIDDEIVFTITPSYGYIVDTLSVTDNTGNVVFDTTDIDRTYGGTYKFTMPASPVIISVNYVKDAYEVIYKDSDDSVIFSEVIKFEGTATLNTIPVVAPSGNHFIGWISADTKTPVTVASLNTADFVINKATVIEAVYDVDNTKVVFSKTVNGYVYNTEIAANKTNTASQSHVYKYADTISFTTVPDEGYTVYEVKVTCKADDGVATNYVPVIKTDDNKYSFVIPEIHKANISATDTDDLTVEVIFCKDEYVLSRGAEYANGKVEINGAVDTETSYIYNYQQLVTITATPNKGYYVKSIVATMDNAVNSTEDSAAGYAYTYTGTVPANGVDGTAQTIKFPMPATDMKYVVLFEKCGYIIDTVLKAATDDVRGTVTINPSNVAQVGDIIEIVADPNDGYQLAQISVVDADNNPVVVAFDSLGLDYVAKYTFTMPAANVTVTAVFKQIASREYIDVRDDDWYYDAVNFVSDRGYFKGYGSTGEIFGVKDNINRQDFVLVIARMNGVDLTAYENVDLPFVDVKKGSYYAPAVAWAVEKGIIYGYKDGSNRFGVGDSILRQDIVTILYRYSKYMNYQIELSAEATEIKENRYSKYRDLKLVSAYAEDAMAWGVGYGVLKGTSETALSPRKTATRAEVAQMLKNLFDHNIAR